MSRARRKMGLLALLSLVFIAAWAPSPARADFTVTLPAGAFALDSMYMRSDVRIQYGDDRTALPLLKGIDRYEPGGGYQGTINANPVVLAEFFTNQLSYGITDNLTIAVALPLLLQMRIDTHLSWREGEYQSSLGRPYSEQDFWDWALSMGQPKPPDTWIGNVNTPADMVVALRYRLPQVGWMKAHNVHWAVQLQGAVPTGVKPDPERLVTIGTEAWDIHGYADIQTHISLEKFWYDAHGVTTLAVGADTFFGWMRPRTYKTATGKRNPLLMTWAPYVGDTYQIDGGDWWGLQLNADFSPFAGPTFATYITKGDMEKAHKLPRLLTFSARYFFLATGQSDWISDSPLWEYDGREELWRPGDKQTFVFAATLSLLRLGAPLQLFARYRTQTLIPGRNTRAADVVFLGVRLIAKFW